MQKFLIAATGFSLLLATAAQAQIDPVTGRPYGVTTPGMPAAPRAPRESTMTPVPSAGVAKPFPAFPAFGSKTTTATQPAMPNVPGTPRMPMIARTHPFSPEGEAARQRVLNKPPAGGPFSPEGEAKRQKAEEKRSNAAASPF